MNSEKNDTKHICVEFKINPVHEKVTHFCLFLYYIILYTYMEYIILLTFFFSQGRDTLKLHPYTMLHIIHR